MREIKGAARTLKFALQTLARKHLVLPWRVADAAGQITRGQAGLDGQTLHQRQKGRAFGKALHELGEHAQHCPIRKRTSRLQECWSDVPGLWQIEAQILLWIVRTRSLRRRPVDERANTELLVKLHRVFFPTTTTAGDIPCDIWNVCR